MKWLALVLVAIGLVGCGEASPASSALIESDGGTGTITEQEAAAVPFCDFDSQRTGLIMNTPCDPSTSFSVDSGHPVAGADANIETTIAFYTCSYQYGGPLTHKCIAAEGAVDRLGRPLASYDVNGGFYYAIPYCVPTCPAAH